MTEPTDRDLQFTEFCEFFFVVWLRAQGLNVGELSSQDLSRKVDEYIEVCFGVARDLNGMADSLEQGLGVTGARVNFDVLQQNCLRVTLVLRASDWTSASLPDDGSTGSFLSASVNSYPRWLQEQSPELLIQLPDGDAALIEHYVAQRTQLAEERGIDFPENTRMVLTTILQGRHYQGRDAP